MIAEDDGEAEEHRWKQISQLDQLVEMFDIEVDDPNYG